MDKAVPLPTTPSEQFLTGLPKAELHLHVEGTLEPDLKLRLAQRNGIDIGQHTVEEVQATYQFHDLASFLAVYYPAMNVLVTEQDFTTWLMRTSRRPQPKAYAGWKCSLTPRRTPAEESTSLPSLTAILVRPTTQSNATALMLN